MSEEEIIGILRMIQEQLGRIEAWQLDMTKQMEVEPPSGSFADTEQ